MRRRNFGLLAGTSLATLKFGRAVAQTAKDPTLLQTTLTPLGGERAGNADGSIPAWTGGFTTLPPGWQTGDSMPDFFADEQPIVTIDSSNMAQHADRLSEGIMALMTKYGFSIKVYPTHRTASAPQWVYDNTASNLTTAQFSPADPTGGRFGFMNAYGGIPFPIPDTSNPATAGAQIVWNHNSRWLGQAFIAREGGYVVSSGQVVLAYQDIATYNYPYYSQAGNLASFKDWQFQLFAQYDNPPNLQGEEFDIWYSTNPAAQANIVWELLNGQGRVRKAPEIQFDTPDTYSAGIINYDESQAIFSGSLEKYDWKYLGKKEMYIPYHNNGLALLPGEPSYGPHFIDPNVVRWELHRVWVVEATLHPGERNVVMRRMLYQDEDTWAVCLGDMYDANNNLFHVGHAYSYLRPDCPGVVTPGPACLHNIQTDDYTTPQYWWDEKANPTVRYVENVSQSIYNPQNMAAAAQY